MAHGDEEIVAVWQVSTYAAAVSCSLDTQFLISGDILCVLYVLVKWKVNPSPSLVLRCSKYIQIMFREGTMNAFRIVFFF